MRTDEYSLRPCGSGDFGAMLTIINAAAQAYRGAIPEDCWNEPYMPGAELAAEMESGVRFWGYEQRGALRGVMGLQHVGDVALIRHAYVHPDFQQQGIGGRLLQHLRGTTTSPLLIGTWAAAGWAIAFYEKHGFAVAPPALTEQLLRRYWRISERQIATSVVLRERTAGGRE